MLFSIITVCYNCEDKIRASVESLLNQNFRDYEYVVIDGGSKDRTFRIVNEYKDLYPALQAISEPDNGIYDAMNKGAKIAQGEYIYFLNAGDTFLDGNVLSNVASAMKSETDIYYGKVMKGDKLESYPQKMTSFYLIWLERMICHQAIFARAKLLKSIPFDIEYKICADRKWLIDSLKSSATYEYLPDVIVCNYEGGGASSIYSNFKDESLNIAMRYAGSLAVVFVRIKRAIGSILGK